MLRPDKFNRVILPEEKKLLESLLEQSLGVERKKPAVKKATTKKAASKKAAPKKTAPEKAEAGPGPTSILSDGEGISLGRLSRVRQ